MKRKPLLLLSAVALLTSLGLAQDLTENTQLTPTVNATTQSFETKLPKDFLAQHLIHLELDTDLYVDADHVMTDRHPSGSNCWIGKIRGQFWGYLILAETAGTIFGKAEMDDGRIFILNADGSSDILHVHESADKVVRGDCHEVMDVDLSEPKEEHGYGDSHNRSSLCDPPACDEVVIDLLIFYTYKAKLGLGGTEASAQSAIAMAVSEMNLINFNSLVHHTFSLVRTEEVDYEEVGEYDIDINALRDPDDGILDYIHDIRDRYYTDLTSLIVGLDGCGFGHVNSDSIRFDAQTSFSIVRDNCMVNKKTLAHEFGHNMGFRHDRYSYTTDGGEAPAGLCGVSFGWVNPAGEFGDPLKAWHTIMAYDIQCDDWGVTCPKIPFWSNPDIIYNDDPIGSSLDSMDKASNAYVFERSACQVKRFREAPDCDSTCLMFQKCANYNPNTELGSGYFTLFTIEEDFPVLDPEKDVLQLCIYYFGDHSHYDELFNLYDENLLFLGQTVPAYDCDMPTRLCFDIIPELYNEWIADGKIEIFLDPSSTAINPEFCRINRSCIELLIHAESLNSATDKTKRLEDNIRLVPNPASDNVVLHLPEGHSTRMTIDLYDLNGLLIRNLYAGTSITKDETIKFSVEDLLPGMYYCQVRDGDVSVTRKLVVAK